MFRVIYTITIVLYLGIKLGRSRKINTECYSHKIRTEILSHNQSLRTYVLPQLNKNVKFSSLFTNCYAIKEFMVCRDYKFSNQGYLPFHKVPQYLSLKHNLTGYLIITDLYRNNHSVSFLENNKFFYSNIQVANYEKTLKKS